jgi:hypothetical protein
MYDSISALINAVANEPFQRDWVYSCLESFREYHQCIFEMEIKKAVFSYENMSGEDYQEMISQLDNARTVKHNSVISNVNALNRLAEKYNIAPVYTGVVSKEQPYRREIADAVLGFVEQMVKERA